MTTLRPSPTTADAEAKPGIWTGLVVGANTKHRGAHSAVLRADGTPLCIVGRADNPQAKADARLLAHLWNKAHEDSVSLQSLN
ncbi:hypothetical protein [Variovorax sp. 278MFTsu5.1]|uniref:hypothetical protein n=1 Tax=Variovorax sp. 278MFTsu5.1 TaxID=3158366 RepID=UPI003AAC578F